jgi:hypothetical protein
MLGGCVIRIANDCRWTNDAQIRRGDRDLRQFSALLIWAQQADHVAYFERVRIKPGQVETVPVSHPDISLIRGLRRVYEQQANHGPSKNVVRTASSQE